MRWPFSLLFRGDRDASAAADAGVAGSGAPGAGPGSDPAADAPSRPAAWPSLPPVQRTIGDAPLTAPAVPFGRELAGLRPPERILRPLAHDLAADGPAGRVSGIATPLVTRGAPPAAPADHVELPPPRGVQRRARTVSGAPVPTADAAPPTGDAEAGFADLPVAPPARVLPFVLPSGAVPALAATRVAASTAPEAARAVAPAAGAVAATAAGSPVQRSAASPAPSAGPAPTTATPPIGPSMGPDAALDAAGPTPGADAYAARPAQARSLGESRRLGLGAPLAGRPSVQRAAAGPDLPLARAGRTSAPLTSPVVAPPPLHRAAAAEAALPVLRVASERGRPATPGEAGAAGSDDVAAAAPPLIPVDADADRGLAGPATLPVQRSIERPLVGEAGRHAASASTDDPEADPAGAAPGEGLPLAIGTAIDGAGGVHGGAAAGDPAPGAPPAATGPFSAGHGGSLPTSQPSAMPAAPASRSVPLAVARSLRGPAPLRPGGGAPGAPPSATPGRTSAPPGAAPGPGHAAAGAVPAAQTPGPPPAGSATSGAPVAQRSPDEDGWRWPELAAPAGRALLPVARAVAAPSGLAAGRAREPVAVSRLADGGGSAPPEPARVLGWSAGSGFAAWPASEPAVVQRAVAIDEVATQVDASSAAGVTVGTGAGGAGQDYEEIADRVYDRIRARFATELLLDRERMGLLIDG